eukprot:735944-Rhodomonas_salina.1
MSATRPQHTTHTHTLTAHHTKHTEREREREREKREREWGADGFGGGETGGEAEEGCLLYTSPSPRDRG